MSAIGNSGARSSGVSGSLVPGCRCGGVGSGRSAARLYQCVGTVEGISTPSGSVRGAEVVRASVLTTSSFRGLGFAAARIVAQPCDPDTGVPSTGRRRAVPRPRGRPGPRARRVRRYRDAVTSSASTDAPTARELADEWVRTLAELDPSVATALGLVPHDDRM